MPEIYRFDGALNDIACTALEFRHYIYPHDWGSFV